MRRLIFALALAMAVLALPGVAMAEAVSSTQLIEEPTLWDGRSVTFTGEAIGEAMTRGDEVWLHLNDDAYADGTTEEGAALSGYNSGQAVVVSPELAGAVTVFGDYRHRGDLVEVNGTFNAACAEHGGDMDIHVTGLRVIRPGASVDDPPEARKLALLAATALFAAATGAAFVYRRSRV